MNLTEKNIVEGALVADAISLGAHWIYDESVLQSLSIDWNTLNAPQAQWHQTKQAGQFTHYGDQLVLLYEYAKDAERFELGSYMGNWYHFMRKYNGYMDAASRNTLENLKARAPLPCGFGSEDLSVVGRIAPLLALADNEKLFLDAIDSFTRATHYTEITRNCARFAGQLLWRLREGISVDSALAQILPDLDPRMKDIVEGAQKSVDEPTYVAIREFGPACNAHQGMPGALHLLFKHKDNYRTAMIENAKSGGDSSARAMVAGMLMVAAYGIDIVPIEWREKVTYQMADFDTPAAPISG